MSHASQQNTVPNIFSTVGGHVRGETNAIYLEGRCLSETSSKAKAMGLRVRPYLVSGLTMITHTDMAATTPRPAMFLLICWWSAYMYIYIYHV